MNVSERNPNCFSVREIIPEIQSLGIRVPGSISGRKGGAGPAEGRAFIVDGFAVHAPIAAPYVARSPYSVASLAEGDGSFRLQKDGEEIATVRVVPEPQYYGLSTEEGVSYRKIALLHGKDCLATTVIQQCVHWKTDRRCAFCGTEISMQNGQTIARKSPEQLAEVAEAAARLDGVTHIVLTSGTADPPGAEIDYLSRCVHAVKTISGLPVHVQFAPPEDPDVMETLRFAGADTVGIHIESWDLEILKRLAPAKAALGYRRYANAWRKAVGLFGSGQVSSFLIAGLGEDPRSIVRGSDVLADLGVYPFVVPLRPIPGSRMEGHTPPEPEKMKKVYESVSRVLRKKGLSAADCKAGCVSCGACSALSAYEEKRDSLTWHTARDTKELEEAFRIRRDVFVEEQQIFRESDGDAEDEISIHLVAESEGRIVGTVRVFPAADGNGHWIGGRLAVRKGFRDSRAGAGLVREAVKRVKENGCTVFTAHIQEKNVSFFRKLGWKPVGPIEIVHGHPHQLMEADLGRVWGDSL